MPETEADALRYTPPRRLKLVSIALLCLAALIVVFGLLGRERARHTLALATTAEAIPTVSLVSPTTGSGARTLVLPGDIRALYEAPIYAQVSGYLKRWYADIGTQVKAGQVLAEIETPDLDQQLAQAKADLATAVANEQLAATTARRWNSLRAQDAVSQQDADDKNGDLKAKSAVAMAARANVDRLVALEGFKRIAAPFDGVVTTRATDIGALISVGTPSQTPLFTVDDEHELRIYVRVPQTNSAEVKPGMTARFTVPEYPGQSFTATLVSTAHAIDRASGTLLVQFETGNPGLRLHPGDYAQVHINLPPDAEAVVLPASALMFRDQGETVATLGAGNRVVLKQVTIGRDFGTTVEIASGLTHADRVINNPPDSIAQGDKVRPASE